MMTECEVRERLRVECGKAGGQKAWAAANGLSQTHVCDVLRGKRAPGGKFLSALGYRRVVMYEEGE